MPQTYRLFRCVPIIVMSCMLLNYSIDSGKCDDKNGELTIAKAFQIGYELLLEKDQIEDREIEIKIRKVKQNWLMLVTFLPQRPGDQLLVTIEPNGNARISGLP